MAEPLKLMYDPQFFERLCPVLRENIIKFNEREFIHRIFDQTWPDLELKQRTRKITLALHEVLPGEFPLAAQSIVALSNALRAKGEKLQSYPYIFLPEYIELYGQSCFEVSMNAILDVTKLVSAEFAIRPFLTNETDRTLAQLLKWTKNEEESVRRLSSEGCRPRLPWARAIPALIKDPSPILAILENLKEDPSVYVRRSVANNLNDIAKDNPEVVIETARRWKSDHPVTQWIIKHGCRTLMKTGNETVLRLNGFDTRRRLALTGMKADKLVTKGDYLHFRFDLCSLGKKPASIRLEYAIDYVTASARISRRIFKIGEYSISPGIPLKISRKQSFKDLTTRRHYEGAHQLWIIANGRKLAQERFHVRSHG